MHAIVKCNRNHDTLGKVGADGEELKPSQLARNVARRDALRRRRETLGPLRDEAEAALRAAWRSRDEAELTAALERGRAACLEGATDYDGIGHRVAGGGRSGRRSDAGGEVEEQMPPTK